MEPTDNYIQSVTNIQTKITLSIGDNIEVVASSGIGTINVQTTVKSFEDYDYDIIVHTSNRYVEKWAAKWFIVDQREKR